MHTYFAMFAAYNRWANERLYAAVSKLPEADYLADRGAFFGSLQRTLNHLLVTDRIWLQRLTGEGPTYPRLDTIVHHDFAGLAADRVKEDARIVAFVDSLTDADIAGTFTYRPITNPRDITQSRMTTLGHLFNHQTHHRGQAHVLITMAAGRDAGPALDLIFFQRETGIGLTA